MHRRPRTIGDSDRWWNHHRQGGNRTSFKRSSAAAILRKSRYLEQDAIELNRILLIFICGRAIYREKPVPTFRSGEHTSELQSLMRISYAVFCLNNKTILHY